MRIAVFSDCYLPAINGVVTSIHQQLEVLDLLGHQVDLFCPRYDRSEGVERNLYRLWARPFIFHKREQFSLPWPPRVLRRMWSQPYDIVHIQTPFSVGLIGMATAWARGLPRVFHHHTLWEEYVDYLPLPKRVTAAGSVALCRGVANGCHGVVAPSREVKERFRRQGVRRSIDVIPTGIRAQAFQGGRALPELGQEEDVCLYVGRLAHEKSLGGLIEVFQKIHAQHSSARLWLVGDGPARDDLEKQVASLGLSEVCRFFGFVKRECLRDYVASARLFLFTSLTETQGLVLLEAQAGGLPVVAYRASGVNEAVEHGVSGFLVEAGEESEMAAWALQLLRDSSLRERISTNAQAWSEKFSVERMGEALVCAYEKALKLAQNRAK